MATRNIVPRATGEGKLGTEAKVWEEIHATEHFGFGTIPVGSVIAWLGGYFSGINTGYTRTVTVNGINLSSDANVISFLDTYGCVHCDGTAPDDPDSPIFNDGIKLVPNLTDDRFLMGDASASVGAIGGDNINYSHYHGRGTLAATTNTDAHTHTVYVVNVAGVGPGLQPTSSGRPYATIGTSSDSHSHTVSFSGVIGDTGGVNGDADQENRPTYISVHYIMRIK